jgi:magnesium transporter
MSVTLVAGIYGMNFDLIPELKWRYGYVYALLSMVGIGVALYAYLKKVNWI